MLIVAWSIYFIITVYLRSYHVGYVFYFIGFLSLALEYLFDFLGVKYDPYVLYFAGLVLGSLKLKDKVWTVLISLFYISLATLFIYQIDIKQEMLTALSILPLFLLTINLPTPKERFYLSVYLTTLIFLNFVSILIFQILNLLFPVYLIIDTISKFIQKKEEELENFRIKLRKNIEVEIQKEIETLEIKLQTAYKKLKEIFKLNSYTIREISIEEIAERVVKGLVDLGYTGVVVEMKKYAVLKKDGFFPNLKTYINEVFPSIENVTDAEDRRVVIIPLYVENEKLGVLAVYSKNEIGNEEIDYLITYAKSIATSIAKIDYFTQLIRLRDLIYTAVSSINIPLVVTNTAMTVEMANNAFLKFVKRDDVAHQNIIELLPILKKLNQPIQDIIHNKTSIQQTIEIPEGKGEKFLEIRVYPVISDEKVESLMFIIEDITEKIQMERQILHSEKLAVIGRLTAGISHEIKNPLAIISQAAFSLKRKISKSCDKEQVVNMNELIERIEKSTDRAKDIIDRLLNFSKPYYNKIENVNIKEVLKEAVKLAMFQTKKSDIKIHQYIKDGYIKGDKNSLIQLFINIIINSIEAISSSGEITIRANTNRKNGVVKVVIKDTGPGIPAELLDKIFEPFFTTKEKGTGLGLAVSYRIVKDHDGEIFVKSNDGQGTEFTVIFPMIEV